MSGPDPWRERVYIGAWAAGAGGTRAAREAATGRELGRFGLADAGDVDRAAAVVADAQAGWRAVPASQRAARLRALAEAVARGRARLTDWLIREAGATRAKADREVDGAVAELGFAAELATATPAVAVPSRDSRRAQAVRRDPVGVVGVITPFNAPFMLAMRALAPAVALGNGVVLKPDPRTAVSGGLVLPDLLAEAGIPAGLVAVLPGGADVGERISEHDGIGSVLFTGSTAVGRRVGAAAGAALKRVGLELGGNNAVLVLKDAELDTAARHAAVSSFLHQGQICMAAGRYLVERPVYERFTDLLAARARTLRVGDPWTDDVDLGPVIDDAAAARIRSVVERSTAAGAVVRCGGAVDGRFVPPTVLADVGPGTPAHREEVFGPVAPVVPVDDADHALDLAQDTGFGLVAAVHTADEARARRIADALRCGTVRINDVTNHDEPQTPMTGWGASGNGAAFGGEPMRDLLTLPKLVSVLRG